METNSLFYSLLYHEIAASAAVFLSLKYLQGPSRNNGREGCKAKAGTSSITIRMPVSGTSLRAGAHKPATFTGLSAGVAISPDGNGFLFITSLPHEIAASAAVSLSLKYLEGPSHNNGREGCKAKAGTSSITIRMPASGTSLRAGAYKPTTFTRLSAGVAISPDENGFLFYSLRGNLLITIRVLIPCVFISIR